jgi:hypothetical protein
VAEGPALSNYGPLLPLHWRTVGDGTASQTAGRGLLDSREAFVSREVHKYLKNTFYII